MIRIPKLFNSSSSLLTLALLPTFAVTTLIGQDQAPQSATIDIPGSWTLVATTGPQARSTHAMAFDAGLGKVVLFGGFFGTEFRFGDTWEWDGTAWSQPATTGPSPRAYTTSVYNAAHHRTVLFGGTGTPSDPNGENNDTWAWDGTKWTQQGVFGPSKRSAHGMAYDSGREQIVLFGGGITFQCDALQDTWELGSTGWIERLPVTKPGVRGQAGMVYDIARGRTVLFGGNGSGCSSLIYGDTWEWDGSSWMQVATTGPSARFTPMMAYDRARRRTVLFGGVAVGGSTFFGDTWEWDGVSWTQVASTGPSPRADSKAAYDGARNNVVLFGGSDESGNIFGDTWEWWGPIYSCSSRAPGDLNCDRVVDADDLAILTSARGAAAFGPADPRDLNRDGQITIEDAQLLASLCAKRGCS